MKLSFVQRQLFVVGPITGLFLLAGIACHFPCVVRDAGGPDELPATAEQRPAARDDRLKPHSIDAGGVTFHALNAHQVRRSEPSETADRQLINASIVRSGESPPLSPYPVVKVSYQETPKLLEAMNPPREYALRQLSCVRFEQRMLDVWGNRLKVSTADGGQIVYVDLPTRELGIGRMSIDRTKGMLTFHGPDAMLARWHQAMSAIDSIPEEDRYQAQVIDTQNAEPETIRKVVALMESVRISPQEQDDQVRRAIPLSPNQTPSGIVGLPDPVPQDPQDPAAPADQDEPAIQEGLSGPVQVEVIPELNLLILKGKAEDIAYVQRVLNGLIQSADAAQPDAEVYPLHYVSGQSIASTLQTLYDTNYAPQTGPVSFTPLDQPNGLLLIGRRENIETAKRLIEKLDLAPSEQPEQFKTFRLKFMSAIDARERLTTYFGQQAAAAPGQPGQTTPSPVTIVADYRSNSIIVKGGSANLALAERLLAELDVAESASKNEVRVFPVRNAVAGELATVLQDAINGQLQNSGQGLIPQTQTGGIGAGGAQNAVQAQAPGDPTSESRLRSAMLELMTVDKDGNMVDGGILFDVRVTADANSNSLVVTGPSRSMNLIAALIERLDVVPDIEVKIKVFRLVHGDAPTLLTMLQQLFSSQTQQQGGFGGFGQTNLQSQLPLQSSSAQAGATLAGLRFSFDTRTNTLIVSGPEGDLQVIEDLIFRLDEADVDIRSIRVYRLSNAPAEDVAVALNSYLDSRRDINAADPGAISAFEQVRRELIVIPEIVSNSLLVSATPKYFAELEPVIQALDRRPSMVKVKVLLAQVTLNALDEFGIELGLQDSLLFDRGASGFGTAGTGRIGFPFNQLNLGNDATAASLATRENLAGQALSNFSLGRNNGDLGYGGLVLSAGNESINVLVRALQDRNALRVLAKPHITTVDNLLARVQVGQKVPTVTAVNQVATGGFSNSVEYTDVGIILEITPRVSPDGTIVMTVNATNSSLEDIATGIPIFTDANGNVIRSPIINETTAETTIMAQSGQTVVISGLLTEGKADIRRGIPYLSDIPFIGPLFRFDSEQVQRSELLIILTPYLVNADEEIDHHNQTEYDRMHWCLGDVNEIYGSLQYEQSQIAIQAADQPVIYFPDADPMGTNPNGGGTNSLPNQLQPTQPAAPPQTLVVPEPGFGSSGGQADSSRSIGGVSPADSQQFTTSTRPALIQNHSNRGVQTGFSPPQ